MAEPDVGPDEFRCERCKGVFTKDWTDEESLAEAQAVFGKVPEPEDRALICTPCYGEFVVWARERGLTVE